jgi:hypothetical protein
VGGKSDAIDFPFASHVIGDCETNSLEADYLYVKKTLEKK